MPLAGQYTNNVVIIIRMEDGGRGVFDSRVMRTAEGCFECGRQRTYAHILVAVSAKASWTFLSIVAAELSPVSKNIKWLWILNASAELLINQLEMMCSSGGATSTHPRWNLLRTLR